MPHTRRSTDPNTGRTVRPRKAPSPIGGSRTGRKSAPPPAPVTITNPDGTQRVVSGRHFDAARKARTAILREWARRRGLTLRDARSLLCDEVQDIMALSEVSAVMLERGVPVQVCMDWWTANDKRRFHRVAYDRALVESEAYAFAEVWRDGQGLAG